MQKLSYYLSLAAFSLGIASNAFGADATKANEIANYVRDKNCFTNYHGFEHYRVHVSGKDIGFSEPDSELVFFVPKDNLFLVALVGKPRDLRIQLHMIDGGGEGANAKNLDGIVDYSVMNHHESSIENPKILTEAQRIYDELIPKMHAYIRNSGKIRCGLADDGHELK